MINYKQQLLLEFQVSLQVANWHQRICVKFDTAALLLDWQEPIVQPSAAFNTTRGRRVIGGGNNPLHLPRGGSPSVFLPWALLVTEPRFGSIGCLLRALVIVLLLAQGQSEGDPLLSRELTQGWQSGPAQYLWSIHTITEQEAQGEGQQLLFHRSLFNPFVKSKSNFTQPSQVLLHYFYWEDIQLWG